MSYEIESPDYAALAAEMLDLFKIHQRINFPDDDELIKHHLAWSLAIVQNELGWQIAPADVTWAPVLIGGADRYACPVQPVASFTVKDDATDVSAEYKLETFGAPVAPVWLVKIDGTEFPAGVAITLVTGFATSAEMPPNIEAAIFRIAGTLYENRESATAYTLDVTPLWLRDLLGGAWIPRA